MRVGNTVRRPLRANADFVLALLQHLERVGFDAAPRFLGIDEQGREMLSFIEGAVPPDLGWYEDAQLVAAARLIRRYHDAVAGSPLVGDEEVVCHNDLSPCNAVFVNGLPIAFIDFDAATPGPHLRDLSYAVWLWLDIGNDEINAREQSRRLRLFCVAYGERATPEFVEAIVRRQNEVASEIAASVDFTDKQRSAGAVWAEHCHEWTMQNRNSLSSGFDSGFPPSRE